MNCEKVEDFSQSNLVTHRFAEKFNIDLQSYQPGFSDFYQLLHMFVRQGQAQHWMKAGTWRNPGRSLELY